MSWGRLDDELHDHPKFIGLDLATIGLWTMCLSWALRRDEDGFIPDGLPERFGATFEASQPLVDRGLWHPDPARCGWHIHDFRDYRNPTSKERTAAYRDRKKSGRDVTVTSPTGRGDGEVTACDASRAEPGPGPGPGSVGKPTSPRASARGEAGKAVQELTETWNGHCSPLPRVTVQPREGKVRHRLMLECHALVEGDMGRLARAIEAASRDPKYCEVPYGVDTFCRHAERWLDATAKPDRDTTTEPPWAGYGFGQLPPDQLNGAAPVEAAGMLA